MEYNNEILHRHNEIKGHFVSADINKIKNGEKIEVSPNLLKRVFGNSNFPIFNQLNESQKQK